MILGATSNGYGIDLSSGKAPLINRTGATLLRGSVVQVDLTQTSSSSTNATFGDANSMWASAVTPTYTNTPYRVYAIVNETVADGRPFTGIVYGAVDVLLTSVLGANPGDAALIVVNGSTMLRTENTGNSTSERCVGFNIATIVNTGEQIAKVFFDGMQGPAFSNCPTNPRNFRDIIKDLAATTTTARGLILTAATGTATSTDNNANYLLVQYAGLGDGVDNIAGWDAIVNTVQTRWEPELICNMRVGTAITDVRYWIGLTDTLLDTVSTVTAENVVAFRYDTSIPDTAGFWTCVSSLGGTGVTETLGAAAIAANGFYKLRIVMASAGTSARFFINDTLVAQHTTNLPVTTTNIGPQARLTELGSAGAGSIRQIRLNRLAIIGP